RYRGQPIPQLWELHEIGQYLASSSAIPTLCGDIDLTLMDKPGVTHSWTEENLRDQFGRLHEMREALALVPLQLKVSPTIITHFRYVGESQTKEADIVANKLGFCLVDDYDEYENEYKLRTELAPGRELTFCWFVSNWNDSDV
ncbi:hypothetical protein AAVH_34226, partial [Aphelenchoides avenae]